MRLGNTSVVVLTVVLECGYLGSTCGGADAVRERRHPNV